MFVNYEGTCSEQENIAYALYGIARALMDVAESNGAIARAVLRLGNADAATAMGAMEALGQVFQDGMNQMSVSILEGLDDIAERFVRNDDEPGSD
jgi:hypothetical protein